MRTRGWARSLATLISILGCLIWGVPVVNCWMEMQTPMWAVPGKGYTSWANVKRTAGAFKGSWLASEPRVFSPLQPRINSRYWWHCAVRMSYVSVTAYVWEESMLRFMWARGRRGVTCRPLACFSSIVNCETANLSILCCSRDLLGQKWRKEWGYTEHISYHPKTRDQIIGPD